MLFVISLHFLWSFALSSRFCLRVRAAVTWVTPAVTAGLMLYLTSRQTCVTALYWSFLPPLHLFPMSTHRPVLLTTPQSTEPPPSPTPSNARPLSSSSPSSSSATLSGTCSHQFIFQKLCQHNHILNSTKVFSPYAQKKF